MYTKFTHRTT